MHTQGTHIGGKSAVSVEWVLCAHTRYTHRREECCVCGVGVVCTHIGGKIVVCGVCFVCTHKGGKSIDTQVKGCAVDLLTPLPM